MSRHKNTIALQSEYYPIRLLLRLLQVLPLRASEALSRLLIKTVLLAMPRRRKLIDQQLLSCFPEKSGDERETLAQQSIGHLARGLAAFARIPAMTFAEMQTRVEIEGFDHIEAALKKGLGAITFTAHYGCWELMAIYVTHLYPEIAMVVRPLDNPKLDRLITAIRGSGGGGVIDSKRVLREGIKLLRKNGILGVLIDQNFYKGGVFVDFFGRPAATNTLVPILAHRTDCVVLPMHNVWINGKIRIICEAPVTLSANPDKAEAIGEDAQTLTGYVERWIREDPSQWLWLHNRWKRRPLPGEPLFSSSLKPNTSTPKNR